MINMFNRRQLQQFGVRFLICLLVLGGLYIAVFGWHHVSHNLPNTPAAKIARLRTALDQTYIDSSTLTSFKQNDPASFAVLSSLIGKLQTDVKALSTDLQTAPTKVPTSQRTQLKSVINHENDAVNALTSRNGALNQVIAYDPQADLGSLDMNSDSATVASRATAAAAGIQKTANDSNFSLVTPVAQKALNTAAACFTQLASQIKNSQLAQAGQTRASCIKNYPVARQAALQNVIQVGLPTSYQAYLKQQIPPLLRELDQLSGGR
jgi:hypothetical protein